MSKTGSASKEMASELEKPLGPEYLSFKNGHAYIEGHKVVKLANEVFGPDGWSSEIRSMTIDYEDVKNARFSLGVSCVMRITLKSGVFREDIGYGSSINMPQKYQAYDKAKKEATTDALKRALRQFGESLGNCLYNKEYVEMVRRLKPEKPTFDEEDLRRPRKKFKMEEPGAQPNGSHSKQASEPADAARQQSAVPANMFDDDYDDEDDFGDLPAGAQRPESRPGSRPSDRKTASEDAAHGTAAQASAPAPAPAPAAAAAPAAKEGGLAPGSAIGELASEDDIVFVTADHAHHIQRPEDQSTPLPTDALFDVSRSNLRNSSIPQDRSMRIPRRPKT